MSFTNQTGIDSFSRTLSHICFIDGVSTSRTPENSNSYPKNSVYKLIPKLSKVFNNNRSTIINHLMTESGDLYLRIIESLLAKNK